MTNRVTILGKLLDTPKVRTFEVRNGSVTIVSLWVEVQDEHRRDRFNVDIFCPKSQEAAKAMPKNALVEVIGKLRHDRWQDKLTKEYKGKIFIALDPGEGSIRSKGLAPQAETAEAA